MYVYLPKGKHLMSVRGGLPKGKHHVSEETQGSIKNSIVSIFQKSYSTSTFGVIQHNDLDKM